MVLTLEKPVDTSVEPEGSAAESAADPAGGRVLTSDEFDALPHNRWRELVDGVIHMVPNPTLLHQDVSGLLWSELRRLAPSDYWPAIGVEVRLGELLRRIPDVLLLKTDGLDSDKYSFEPEQVVLVVEVVSPGSQTTDRLNKFVEYAAAGIEHYWRIETRPDLVVYAYQLVEGQRVYGEATAFKEGQTVDVPGLSWAQVDVSSLAL